MVILWSKQTTKFKFNLNVLQPLCMCIELHSRLNKYQQNTAAPEIKGMPNFFQRYQKSLEGKKGKTLNFMQDRKS